MTQLFYNFIPATCGYQKEMKGFKLIMKCPHKISHTKSKPQLEAREHVEISKPWSVMDS